MAVIQIRAPNQNASAGKAERKTELPSDNSAQNFSNPAKGDTIEAAKNAPLT